MLGDLSSPLLTNNWEPGPSFILLAWTKANLFLAYRDAQFGDQMILIVTYVTTRIVVIVPIMTPNIILVATSLLILRSHPTSYLLLSLVWKNLLAKSIYTKRNTKNQISSQAAKAHIIIYII